MKTAPAVQPENTAIDWLLACPEPAVRRLARRDLLGQIADEDVLAGPWVRALLGDEEPETALRPHPYSKWDGAHWRLVSLVELEVPPDEPRLRPMVERVLGWLRGPQRTARLPVVAGKVRRCASQDGNALAVCARLGLADDDRVRALTASLLSWRWPDGGWNCDRRESATGSSFHETLPPIWGLHEYATATGSSEAREAALAAAELLLERRLFRRRRDGSTIHRSWVALHFPPYWHYDVLQALLVLGRLGLLDDPRVADALDVLVAGQRQDGRWEPGGSWWRPAGSPRAVEVVDWGRSGPNYMLTLNALRVLTSAGRSRA